MDKSINLLIIEKILKIADDNLLSIILFGSQARKNYNDSSDIDIIVVLNDYKKYSFSSLVKYFLIEYNKKVDIQIFSKKDILDNFEDFSPLFVSLLLGKRILFDREMFFQKSFVSFVKKMVYQPIIYCEGGESWEMRKIAKNLEILQ